METYTLFSLNQYIRQVLALNFPEPLWVRCEIHQASHSRGHVFMKLVQKAEEGEAIVAQSDAVCWSSTYRKLSRKYGERFEGLLEGGKEVRLQVVVDFHERYGHKLKVEDIDPAFTLGKMEAHRRQILEQLAEKGWLDMNARLELPPVLQRIAVLSNDQAAGWHDFKAHIEGNPFGYAYSLSLFPTSLQGDLVEKELGEQLDHISRRADAFDAVVLLRGGGARLDLAAFDSFALGQKVAHLPLPFLTGIGHEIDLTVLDRTAHTHLKTPTAVADFLLSHNLAFDQEVESCLRQIARQTEGILLSQEKALVSLDREYRYLSQTRLTQEWNSLLWLQQALPAQTKYQMQKAGARLDNWESLLHSLDPQTVLKRGYSLTSRRGKIIRQSDALQAGDHIRTRFADGEVESKVLPKS